MSDINPANAAKHAEYRSACNEYRSAATPQAQIKAATRAAYLAPLPALEVSWELKASRARCALAQLLGSA